jgi:hypothetical protein
MNQIRELIEHRLYDIELVSDNNIIEQKMCLISKERLLWYYLKGYNAFDYNESLGMDSWYYEEEIEIIF